MRGFRFDSAVSRPDLPREAVVVIDRYCDCVSHVAHTRVINGDAVIKNLWSEPMPCDGSCGVVELPTEAAGREAA